MVAASSVAGKVHSQSSKWAMRRRPPHAGRAEQADMDGTPAPFVAGEDAEQHVLPLLAGWIRRRSERRRRGSGHSGRRPRARGMVRTSGHGEAEADLLLGQPRFVARQPAAGRPD